MKKGKAKKATQSVKSSTTAVINKDITETIRSSYQAELKTQTASVQSLKKSLKTLTSQLSKAVSKRKMLKKKKMAVLKKVGANPRATDKKLIAQMNKEFDASFKEVKSLQQALEQNRQDFRLGKEQVKKLTAIIRSIQKMEKQWDKAIAAKFRAKPKKKAVAKKMKKAAVVAMEPASAPVAAAPKRARSPKVVKEQPIVMDEATSEM